MSKHEKLFDSIRESIENEEILSLEQLEELQEYAGEDVVPPDIVEYLIESHKNLRLERYESVKMFSEWDNEEDYDMYH